MLNDNNVENKESQNTIKSGNISNFENHNLNMENQKMRIQEQKKPNSSYKVTPKPIKTFLLFSIIFFLVGSIFVALLLSTIFIVPNQINDKLLANRNNNSLSGTKYVDTRNNLKFAPQKQALTAVEVVNKNLPSVVSINITSKLDSRSTAGSGFIVSSDGLIVSNKHVVSFACTYGKQNLKISALTFDQKVYNLELQSIDPVDDIAILKIVDSPSNLSKVEFGDSTKLQLGEDVIAIGNALGNLQNTVTKGVISGLDRSFEAQNLKDECTNNEFRTDGLIQTDAAINKGNSGGPLFNASGQIIGMNTLGTDAQSVGLAIPSSTILTSLNSYLANKTIIRARLGVMTQEINNLRKLQKPWLPVDYGEFVGGLDSVVESEKVVATGSAAQEVGIKYGDIILEINGEKLNSTNDNPSPLRRSILNKQAGETIDVTVLQADENYPMGQKINYKLQSVKLKIKLKGVNFDLNQAVVK
jgi:serine protease Do